MRHISRSHVAIAIAAALATWIVPAAAREVVDYARDAGSVDGFSAVGHNSEERSRKLVATNPDGFLPNDIVRKVRKAEHANRAESLRGYGPSAFVRTCMAGALRGQAHVTPDVGAEMEEVAGFRTLYGGPVDPDGNSCHVNQPTARRIGAGIFDVDAATTFWDCETPLVPDAFTALITVESAEPLLATYEPVCDGGSVYARVHITDLQGQPQDASFTLAVLRAQGIPIP